MVIFITIELTNSQHRQLKMDKKVLLIKERLKNIQQYLHNLLEQKNSELQKIVLAFETIDDIYLDIEYSKPDKRLLEPEISLFISTINELEEYLKKLELQYKDQLKSIAKHKKAVKIINNL